MRSLSQLKALALLWCIALAGCGGFGRVNQGRVIEYQRDKGLVKLIGDSNYREPAHPRFDVLPPVTIRTPEDPLEMGPEPEAGKLLLLDWRNRRVVIFDPGTQGLRTIPYTLLDERDDVNPTDLRVRGARLPAVDRAKKTITVYLRRDRKLVVFSVADEHFALPDDTWRMGDEVRYYYKDPSRALRFMNISKTDLNKAGQ